MREKASAPTDCALNSLLPKSLGQFGGPPAAQHHPPRLVGVAELNSDLIDDTA
jgi:hypothetical protein